MSEEFWNEMFGDNDYRYGTKPNAFLAQHATASFKPNGRVVCLGDGEGRNSVWLAEQGFDVTAVDQSSAGLSKLQKLADARSVSVNSVQGRAESFEGQNFDAVVLIYLHAPPEMRQKIHRKAVELLAPGGVVLLEGFTPEQRQLNRTSGGPQDVSMLFTEAMLRDDFEDLEIEYIEAVEVELDEGPGHRGTANVIRMIARKKE